MAEHATSLLSQVISLFHVQSIRKDESTRTRKGKQNAANSEEEGQRKPHERTLFVVCKKSFGKACACTQLQEDQFHARKMIAIPAESSMRTITHPEVCKRVFVDLFTPAHAMTNSPAIHISATMFCKSHDQEDVAFVVLSRKVASSPKLNTFSLPQCTANVEPADGTNTPDQCEILIPLSGDPSSAAKHVINSFNTSPILFAH